MTLPKRNLFTIDIGLLNVKLARVDDPEKLFDDFLKSDPEHETFIDERIPYWSELWPSAIGLSEFILENQELIKGKRVVEIGCGLGLPGIVSGMLGGNVILTDYLQDALDFAVYNWKLNITKEPAAQILDWRMPGNFEPADVLLASDIAYESRSFVPVLHALKKLTLPGGVVLLSEPNRDYAKSFFESIKKEFIVSVHNKTTLYNGIKNRISIYSIKRL